jgi:hypothetical protein
MIIITYNRFVDYASNKHNLSNVLLVIDAVFMVLIYFLMGYAKCKNMKVAKGALLCISIFHH